MEIEDEHVGTGESIGEGVSLTLDRILKKTASVDKSFGRLGIEVDKGCAYNQFMKGKILFHAYINGSEPFTDKKTHEVDSRIANDKLDNRILADEEKIVATESVFNHVESARNLTAIAVEHAQLLSAYRSRHHTDNFVTPSREYSRQMAVNGTDDGETFYVGYSALIRVNMAVEDIGYGFHLFSGLFESYNIKRSLGPIIISIG